MMSPECRSVCACAGIDFTTTPAFPAPAVVTLTPSWSAAFCPVAVGVLLAWVVLPWVWDVLGLVACVDALDEESPEPPHPTASNTTPHPTPAARADHIPT